MSNSLSYFIEHDMMIDINVQTCRDRRVPYIKIQIKTLHKNSWLFLWNHMTRPLESSDSSFEIYGSAFGDGWGLLAFSLSSSLWWLDPTTYRWNHMCEEPLMITSIVKTVVWTFVSPGPRGMHHGWWPSTSTRSFICICNIIKQVVMAWPTIVLT